MGIYKESEPKTRTGRRKIVLPDVAVEALKEHRIRQDQIRSEADEKWHEHGIVFCNNIGGFFNPDRLLKIFNRLLRNAGLPHMRFHDLRHSAATIFLSIHEF